MPQHFNIAKTVSVESVSALTRGKPRHFIDNNQKPVFDVVVDNVIDYRTDLVRYINRGGCSKLYRSHIGYEFDVGTGDTPDLPQTKLINTSCLWFRVHVDTVTGYR